MVEYKNVHQDHEQSEYFEENFVMVSFSNTHILNRSQWIIHQTIEIDLPHACVGIRTSGDD